MLLLVELLHSSTKESYVPLLALYTNNLLKHIKRKKVVATNSAETESIYDWKTELRALREGTCRCWCGETTSNIRVFRNTVLIWSEPKFSILVIDLRSIDNKMQVFMVVFIDNMSSSTTHFINHMPEFIWFDYFFLWNIINQIKYK